ncbi:Nibrin [Pseudolycoriella hygida]|uniref:Nibrin n=1 Tax=Pseudolycoriella hygida TaxID=35572 RepID=A0A9Q0MLJ1_9DIPT|nr:Nibrin [Pseudolycoriella hygida]
MLQFISDSNSTLRYSLHLSILSTQIIIMWILSRVNTDDKFYLLCDKPKYTVGRNKNCDIVGEPTQSSLGRLHATLYITEDRVEVEDTKSKYGTYINDGINVNEKIEPSARHTLNDGDTIRFGFIDFTWKLEKTDFIVLSTSLTNSEKDNLRKDVSTLGGRMINGWSDTCTHLVVKNLTFTVKLLQALCHAIPIVKPEYFKTMVLAIRSNGMLPNVDNFHPIIVDRLIAGSDQLKANINRKRLFVGKTFVFMNSKDMATFKGVIECGMGKCSSLDTHKWQRRSLVKPDCIVINSSSAATQSQAATQVVDELSDFLRSKGCRIVPDSEISLAILYCSLDKFCNPKHTLKDNFENDKRIVVATSLVDNTPENQNEHPPSSSTNSINIPETIEQPSTLAASVPSNSNVIDLMDDDDDFMLVQGVDLAMISENKGKRKMSTENDEPASKKPHLAESSQRRSTRSTASHHSINGIGKTSAVKQKERELTEEISDGISNNNDLLVPQIEIIEKNSSEISAIEYPASQKRVNSTNSFQSQHVTSTQNESSKRKRIAHRPSTSFAASNNSDSDDELFKLNSEPSNKKPKQSRDIDSDSDDHTNYPISTRPVPMVYVPSQSFTQPNTSGSWISRPTPSQASNDTKIRTKSYKKNPVEKPKSAGWQIGQFWVPYSPIKIPTQGWLSKSTIVSDNQTNKIKEEDTDEKTLSDDSKLNESEKSCIQVITKSMNLMSTGGKVFKKQRFIVPKEIIKTSKIYEF